MGHYVHCYARYLVTNINRQVSIHVESCSALCGKMEIPHGLVVCGERERITVLNFLASDNLRNTLL